MKARDVKALHGSINKWIRIAEWRDLDRGADNCPLCTLYNPGFLLSYFPNKACVGCPVRAVTGKSFCKGTPYTHWTNHLHMSDAPREDRRVFDARSQRLAEVEALFLISLLPKQEQSRYFTKEKTR